MGSGSIYGTNSRFYGGNGQTSTMSNGLGHHRGSSRMMGSGFGGHHSHHNSMGSRMSYSMTGEAEKGNDFDI